MQTTIRQRIKRHLVATWALAGILFSLSCAPQAKVETAPPSAELEKKAAEAEVQVKRGCYTGFKQAIEIYQELDGQPSMKKKIALPYLRALLLMAVREREVGILSHANFEKALELIKDNPALGPFQAYFEIADSMSPRTRGIMQDISVMAVKKVYDDLLMQRKVQEELRTKALAEDYYAYLYAAFYTGYGFFAEKRDEFVAEILSRYPESMLLKYKNAIYPQSNREKLEALILADPEFYEAYYNLGEMSIGGQDLLEAEKNFLKALEGLTESPQVTIYLGSIYTATEEFEKSLEFYDKTLALSPKYRDALLGKAISLSYLGEYQEAIEVLNKNVELGFYLMGESHYWLAWNYHELKDNDRAQLNIEESKGRLPTNSEVFGLSGTIAFEKGEIDRAEKEFFEALRYNGRNTEALYSLGRLYGQKEKWPDSANYYRLAALVFDQNETAITAKISEIKNSKLSEERKAKMAAKKEQQLKIIQATKATAFYNAAASYYNAGQKAIALEMAARAATHPQFKEKAEELIKQVKKISISVH